MTILEALRKRRTRASQGEPPPTPSSPEESAVPIGGYDQLSEKEVTGRLSQLSQVELAAVETYERGHGNRPAALDKLRYMRDTEPLPRKRRSFVKVTRTEPIPDTKNRWVGIP